METASSIQPLLRALRERLGALYGDRLVRVVLYGSHARGEATGDSDVDVMIVLRGPVNEWEEIQRAREAIYPAELEHDEAVALLPLAHSEFRTRQSRFLENVRREGVAL